MPELDLGGDNLGVEGDAFYEAFLQAHEGLDEKASQALNIRIVLLMANQIGDYATLEKILETAASHE